MDIPPSEHDAGQPSPPQPDFQAENVLLRDQLAAVQASEVTLRSQIAALYATDAGRQRTLDALNKKLDDLLYRMSHELRTPLTSMKLATQMAQVKLRRLVRELDSGTVAILGQILDGLDISSRQIDIQNRMIGDLLDLSRIEGDRINPQFALHNLLAIVHRSCATAHKQWPERTFTLDLAGETTIPVIVDDERMQQAILHYLRNAVMYAPLEFPITIAVRREADRVSVIVSDLGPGLPLDQQQSIWESFYRVPDIISQPNHSVAMGIGLTIVRGLMAKMGGQASVHSEHGKGAAFALTLPIATSEDMN